MESLEEYKKYQMQTAVLMDESPRRKELVRRHHSGQQGEEDMK